VNTARGAGLYSANFCPSQKMIKFQNAKRCANPGSGFRSPLPLSFIMNANRLQSAAPTNGSRTITLTTTSAPSGTGSHSDVDSNSRPPDGVLRLRGGPRRRDGPRVTWGEEVVDNEGCGKKKSKSILFCSFVAARLLRSSLLHLPQAATLR
jgi:hypothetical protein